MKIKTSELTGNALALAVFIAQGGSYWLRKHAKFDNNGAGLTEWVLDTDGVLKRFRFDESYSRAGAWRPEEFFEPHIDWSQGGPIIERERITVLPFDERWEARCARHIPAVVKFEERRGPTALIAAMRCYVASRLGDEVDVPEELLC